MTNHTPLPPYEEVSAAFVYDPDTGLFFHKNTKNNHCKAGSIAGTKEIKYIRIRYKFKAYLAHRLAWLMYYKEDPAHMQVDHVDNDKLNNRINNLRLASRTQNRHNTVAKGYSKYKDKWKAYIRQDGVYTHLGIYGTEEEAHAVYMAEVVRRRGEFAPIKYHILNPLGSPRGRSRAT